MKRYELLAHSPNGHFLGGSSVASDLAGKSLRFSLGEWAMDLSRGAGQVWSVRIRRAGVDALLAFRQDEIVVINDKGKSESVQWSCPFDWGEGGAGTYCPAPQAGYVRLGPCFVQEHRTPRVEPGLTHPPYRPGRGDVGPILLGGVDGLFCKSAEAV